MNRTETIHRLLTEVELPTEEEILPKALEGEKDVRPAGWLRFETGDLTEDQEMKNLETVVSLLQTARQGMEKIDARLVEAIQGIHAHWGEAPQEAPQGDSILAKIDAMLAAKMEQVDQLVRGCRFHGRGLLDGQSGLTGWGEGVDFIRGGPDTQSSPVEGYEVKMESLPTRGYLLGSVPVDEDWIRAETEIVLTEGDRFVRFRPTKDMGPQEFVQGLNRTLMEQGLSLEAGLTRQGRLVIRHVQYGSQPRFKGCSRSTPLLSRKPGRLEWNRRGRDIQGTLGGEPAFGMGRVLMGYLDNRHTAELAVAWRGDLAPAARETVVHVIQNGLRFQDAAGHGGEEDTGGMARLSLPALAGRNLGRWVDTFHGFSSLSKVRVEGWRDALDGLLMLYAVSGEMEEWKERVSIWIERYQNRAMAVLRRGRSGRSTDGEAVAPKTLGAKKPEVAKDMAEQFRRHLVAG
ncbi:MAG: hypothetical protein OEV94_10385 [Deltaproteobacteria bacterium]|nr:hypothetical protein [Deltaproteobacteria bacterium]